MKPGTILAIVVLSPFAALVAGIGGCEAAKAYYDWRVDAMCEKDGGLRVYEQIVVTPKIAASMGRVGGHLSITHEEMARAQDPAFLRVHSSDLRDGYIRIRRYENSIVRRTDGKTVGILVRYWRSGGDFPFTVSHPTSYTCPASDKYYEDQAKIFVVQSGR